MKKIGLITLIVAVQSLFLWSVFELLGNSRTFSSRWFLVGFVPLLLLNLLPFCRNHRRYGLQYGMLLLLLAGMLVFLIQFVPELAICLPFIWLFLSIANTGYVCLSTNRFRDYLLFPVVTMVATLGTGLLIAVNLADRIDVFFAFFDSEDIFPLLFIGGYLLISILLDLLVVYRIGQSTVFFGIAVLLWLVLGIWRAQPESNSIWIWCVSVLVVTGGQYWIARRLRNFDFVKNRLL